MILKEKLYLNRILKYAVQKYLKMILSISNPKINKAE